MIYVNPPRGPSLYWIQTYNYSPLGFQQPCSYQDKYLNTQKTKRIWPQSPAEYKKLMQNTLNSLATVGANLIGFLLAGLTGAIIMGGLRSLLSNGAEQQYKTGQINGKELMLNGFWGLLPNIIGEIMLRKTNQLANQTTGHYKHLAASNSFKRTVLINIIDGALLNIASEGFKQWYKAIKEHKSVNTEILTQSIELGWLPGVLGGALAGVAFTLVNSRMNRSLLARKI